MFEEDHGEESEGSKGGVKEGVCVCVCVTRAMMICTGANATLFIKFRNICNCFVSVLNMLMI